ncbi:MAG: dihydropteroate synthase [Olsenella sp.]|jgi:dihydropteroate synthase
MLRENYATWHCAGHEISLARPHIMGILNVTPDSFSDGGKHADAGSAIAYGLKMLDDGADIIDVGGESTRPGATPVDPETELARILPVVRALADAGAIVSVDTYHPQVAEAVLEAGASILNDVTGFTDPEMVRVASESDCGLIVMYWNKEGLGTHATRRSVELDVNRPNRPVARRVPSARRFTLPEEAQIMRQVMGFLGDQARKLMRAGIAHDRICIDPGPGFDKFADEDVVIQRATPKMVSMGYAYLCAPSRKRFVGAVSGVTEADRRDAATIGICLGAVEGGCRLLRVHNVPEVAQAVDAFWAVRHPDARQAFISLGTDVGDVDERLDALGHACRLIDEIPLTCVVNVSHAYETDPAYGLKDEVANAVAEIRTELAPLVLLDALMKVEQELGRTRPEDGSMGPRTIDCDLAWYEGETHAGNKLTLPHKGLGERDYVLVPMEDLLHDPVRFLAHSGVEVLPPEERVGHVRRELGRILWEA